MPASSEPHQQQRNHSQLQSPQQRHQRNSINANAYHCPPDCSQREWYNNLKAIAEADGEAQDLLRRRLRSHIDLLKTTRHKDITVGDLKAWLTTQEALMAEAAHVELVETKEPGIWFVDVMDALRNQMPHFIATYRLQHRRHAHTLNFRDVSRDIRRAIPSHLPTTASCSGVSKGSPTSRERRGPRTTRAPKSKRLRQSLFFGLEGPSQKWTDPKGSRATRESDWLQRADEQRIVGEEIHG